MKILKPGKMPADMVEIECYNCEAVLGVEKGDVYYYQDLLLSNNKYHYIICPWCRSEIRVIFKNGVIIEKK